MKILMWMVSAGGEVPGGHRVQMDKTAAALRAAGVAVRTAVTDDPCLEDEDVVHGFGLSEAHIAAVKQRGAAVAVSPIYVGRSYGRVRVRAESRVRYARVLARGAVADGASAMRLRRPWYFELQRRFRAADVLLPNSEAEGHALRRELRLRTPMVVVPNGIDAGEWGAEMASPSREYVAYVGRIEPHKNQLGLIEALKGTGLPLVIAGPVHPHHETYLARCYAAAEGEAVSFRPATAGAELRSIFAGARVHAMPSFFETTGLASLEAGASGCAIVSTSEGWASEYFGELATYCRPGSERSIRRAVLQSWNHGPRPELKRRIFERFTWSHAAQATLAAYQSVLGCAGESRLTPG